MAKIQGAESQMVAAMGPGANAHRLAWMGRGRRRGMTLLELLLALGLTVIVLMAVGMAINMNLRTLESRRNQVEEGQLARAVFRMIGDDLRGSLRSQAIDFSESLKLAATVQTAAAAQQAQTTTGSSTPKGNNAKAGGGFGSANTGGKTGGGQGYGAGGSTPAASGQSGTSNSGGSGGGQGYGAGAKAGKSGGYGSATASGTSTDSTSQTDTTTTTTPPNVPGLYGSQYELQIDVTRLPRGDEYSGNGQSIGQGGIMDIPSDVKSVTYYMRNGSAPTDPSTTPLTSTQNVSSGSGLARRSVSRLVARHAMDNGNLSSLESLGEIIAPEVTSVEFHYFDGTEWMMDWNSDDRGQLPVAIEILLTMNPLHEPKPNEPQQLTFRLVVPLPAGAASSATSSASSSTTSQSGTTTGSTSTGTTSTTSGS